MLTKNNKFEQILGNFNMEQLITEPTHLTLNSQTLINIIATTSSDLVTNARVKGPSLSNHCDIEAEIVSDSPKKKLMKRIILNYKSANWQNIDKELGNHNWEHIYTKNL